ncbi:MAG TPA: dihydroneopterin aldolase, partial [Gemmatimonadaceae bacterium]|nr:dihydroneopterin aldolase [Gemmatimonadaceae bacterium]
MRQSDGVGVPRDRVTLKGMRFHTRVGVLPHESEVAQPVEVDVSAEVDLGAVPPGVVDYSAVYAGVAEVMGARHINYLEEAAERIAARVLGIAGVVVVHVAVRKPH